MADFQTYLPRTRIYKEDGTQINFADVIVPEPVKYETLTIDDTTGGVGLTAATYSGASTAMITVETAPVRFKRNGDAPTASDGVLLNVGDILILQTASQIANFKAIRAGSTSASIAVEYGA